MRLEWMLPQPDTASGELDREQTQPLIADLERLFEFELGLGQSPPVKPYTIRELVRNTRAIALVPAAAGSLAAAASIALGNWSTVMMAALTGGGSAIVLGSSLWFMDKLFKGVKHLDAVPTRRHLPPGRPQAPPVRTKKSR